MSWHWLTERRRKHLLEHPFPPSWERALRAVAMTRTLDEKELAKLRDLVQVFVAEKQWEGCGGLTLTSEMRVTIATQACMLLLGRDHALFDDVESILVYPSTFVRPARPRRWLEPTSVPEHGPDALLGEAHLHGPVILVWDAVRSDARDAEDGHNVVLHEFAHKIDMLDGHADGTPPLRGQARIRAWAAECETLFLALKEHVARGEPTFLAPYAATNEAEFFAVATEAFFERPAQLRRAAPGLYALFVDFYAQDPAERESRAAHSS